MDRLETGLIREVIDWDEVDNMGANTSTLIHRIECKYKKNLRELMLKIEFCIFYILQIKKTRQSPVFVAKQHSRGINTHEEEKLRAQIVMCYQ